MFLKFQLCALFCSLLVFSQAEESNTSSSTPKAEDKNWLQGYIQEQQKLQENRKTDSKENPFKALEKPSSEKNSKNTDSTFSLLGSSEKKTPPTASPLIETNRPKTTSTDLSFKPAVSGMNAEIYNQQRRENESRSMIEQSEKINSDSENRELNDWETLEKMRKQRLQQNLKSREDVDRLMQDQINMPSSFDHQNLEGDRKNPYLQQNQTLLQREREKLQQEAQGSLPRIQMIRPIEAPQMIPQPSLPRSSFDPNPFQNNQNSNPMLQMPGTQKRGVQDPNDFLRR